MRGTAEQLHPTLRPWTLCGDKCNCGVISGEHHPVAKVFSGKWGDDYPDIRLVGESSLNLKAEPFMNQITYGEIPLEKARANAAFIVLACNTHDALLAALKYFLSPLPDSTIDFYGWFARGTEMARQAIAKAGDQP